MSYIYVAIWCGVLSLAFYFSGVEYPLSMWMTVFIGTFMGRATQDLVKWKRKQNSSV